MFYLLDKLLFDFSRFKGAGALLAEKIVFQINKFFGKADDFSIFKVLPQ